MDSRRLAARGAFYVGLGLGLLIAAAAVDAIAPRRPPAESYTAVVTVTEPDPRLEKEAAADAG